MAYRSTDRITRQHFLTHGCPYLVNNMFCGGGDYCPFPPGQSRICCFYCPLFEDCPDDSGICTRFLDDD